MVARRVRGVVRPFVRETAAGERWWYVALPGRRRPALGLRESEATYEEAHRIACQRYAAGTLAAGGAGPSTEATFRDLIKAYLKEQGPHWKARTLAGFKLLLAAFEEAMTEAGVARPSELTTEKWGAYVAGRQEGDKDRRGVSNATINRTIAAVRPMAKWGRTRTPPLLPDPTLLESVKNLREVQRAQAPVIPSPEEWAKVVEALAGGVLKLAYPEAEGYRAQAEANDRGIALLVAVAVQTGMRLDELRHVRAEDVARDAVRVAAWGEFSPKSHAERAVPIPAETVEHVRELVAWRDQAVGLNGAPLALGEAWISDRLDAAWATLDIVGDAPRMHDARRTFATELSRAGQPLTLIRDRMGHKDVATTERYLGQYRSDAARVVPNLGVGASLARRRQG